MGRTTYLAVLVSAALVTLGMWLYAQRLVFGVFIRPPIGKAETFNSDLYPPWRATHLWLYEGRNPYGEEVAQDIQTGIYGRPLRPGEDRDQHRFAYPAYVLLLMAPLAILDFPLVHAITWPFLMAAVALQVVCWLEALGGGSARRYSILAVVLALGSFAAVQGIQLRQLGVLVSLFLALSVYCLSRDRLAQSGIWLGLAFIKPHFAVPVAAWLVLWCLGDIRARKPLLLALASTLLLPLVASELVLPGWISAWLHNLTVYQLYTGSTGVLAETFGIVPGRTMGMLLLFGVFAVGWSFRRDPHGSTRLPIMAAAVLSVALLLVPTWAYHNQLFLLPLYLTLALQAPTIARMTWAARAIGILLAVSLLWERIAAAALAVASLEWVPSDSLIILPLVPYVVFPFIAATGAAIVLLNIAPMGRAASGAIAPRW